MPFEMQLDEVEYQDSGQGPLTLLRGILIEGEITGPEWIEFKDRDNKVSALKMVGVDIEGPFTDPSARNLAGKIGRVTLVLDGHAEGHALRASMMVSGVGSRKPKCASRRS